MPQTNAEYQRRFRSRNVVVLTASAEQIAERLIGMKDQSKLRWIARLIGDHINATPCGTCDGSGQYRMAGSRCSAKKPTEVTEWFPCPECRPAEYFVASGGALRREGRFADAFVAALKVMDNSAAADTFRAWGISPKEAQAALRKLDCSVTQTDLAYLRDYVGL